MTGTIREGTNSELRRYVTVDVFTQSVFGGNPLAVVLEAAGLSSAQMQSIATEFNYSETTFILPPRTPEHTAHVRIFTSRSEVPFAGHPNVGTAVALAHDLQTKGAPPVDEFVFEEAVGLVAVRLLREGGLVVGAEFTAPEKLSVLKSVSSQDAADCLSLPAAQIAAATHLPQVISVGLPFLVAEVVSRDALRQAKPNLAAHQRVLPPADTDAIYAYWREPGSTELHARMFAPLDGTVEDPATGSATASTIALLALSSPDQNNETSWRILQGADMGRPSEILGRTQKRAGQIEAVHIAGHAVEVMQGSIRVPPLT